MVDRSSKATAAIGAASTRSPNPIPRRGMAGRTGTEVEWLAAKRERKIITKTDNIGPCSHEKIRSQAPDFFILYFLFLSLG